MVVEQVQESTPRSAPRGSCDPDARRDDTAGPQDPRDQSLTVLIPAYNEAKRLPGTLTRILSWAGRHPGSFGTIEVLVVDDGSSDGTATQVKEQFGTAVRLKRRPQRGGKGAAIRTGVQATRTDWLLFVDADASIPIEEAQQLFDASANADLVIGSKRAPGSSIHYPLTRRLLGAVGQGLIQLCVVRGFHDTQCGFKLFRTPAARQLFRAQRIDGFGFDFEVLFLAQRLGYRIAEVPIRCKHQAGGTIGYGTYLSVLKELCTLQANRLLGVYPKPVRPGARGRTTDDDPALEANTPASCSEQRPS